MTGGKDDSLTSGHMRPEQALHDLTLALIYLTRLTDSKSDFFSAQDFQAWKNYNWATIDELDKEGLVSSRHGNKSLWLTADGVAKAREILSALNVDDWKPEDVNGPAAHH